MPTKKTADIFPGDAGYMIGVVSVIILVRLKEKDGTGLISVVVNIQPDISTLDLRLRLLMSMRVHKHALSGCDFRQEKRAGDPV
ncbi:MAG: hypothetical protein OXN16_11940 [Gammaproteobacteria bacterium]|nr:hypothetical protein [Gammaproteobacteria bacterium]MDE0281769.1 hypothetical protein [Gammaproteobacteria bacterium]